MKVEAISLPYKRFVEDIHIIFSKENNTLFSKRNTIKSTEYNGTKYAIKSFKVPHLLNQIVYRFFRASKALRSYENSLRLRKLNVNTPRPIGYAEHPSFLLFKSSYYVSEFYEFDFEIREVLLDAHFEDRLTILKGFVNFSYDLHNKGVYHSDYSPGNVIIKKCDGSYEFAIIDVNRMKFIKYDNAMRFKNLSRFSTSDDDLKLIAIEYAKLSGIDEDFAIEMLFTYHIEHQEYLKRKKNLKALRG